MTTAEHDEHEDDGSLVRIVIEGRGVCTPPPEPDKEPE